MLDRKQWRYKNLSKEWIEPLERAAPLIERDFNAMQGPRWRHCFPGWVSDLKMITSTYAYGLPMDLVCRTIQWKLEFDLKRFRAELDDPEKRIELRVLGRCYLNLLELAVLIDDRERLAQIGDLLDRVIATGGKASERAEKELRAVCLLAGKQFTPELRQLAGNLQSLNPSAQWFVALRDPEGLKKHAQDLIEELSGSIQARKAKRSADPSDLFDPYTTATMAYALDCGMPLTLIDPAYPVWDFPIAKRPEIRALLPESVR